MAAPKTPKRYSVTLDPKSVGKGMKLVSLVKAPAIGIGWVALSKEVAPLAKRIALSKEAKKQVITGPLLVPGLDIARIDDAGDVFFINFSAEEIEKIGQRFMLDAKGLALSNQNHADELTGNHICELWLTADSAIDKAALHGFDVPAGTLMASMKVSDSDFWKNEVESGNVTGFSIEGLFDFSELKLQAASAAPKKPMTFLQKLAAALAVFSTSVALAAVELKDGTALEVDDVTGEVFTLDAEGKRSTAQADGDYELSDGTAFVVKDGKHTEHKAAETAPVAEKLASDTAAPADAPKAAESAAEIDAPAVEKLLGSIETEIAEVRALLKGEKPAAADAPKAAETKLAAVKLEAVEMLDGSTLSINPITRIVSDANGAQLPTGYHACKDGSFFKVESNQYTYQIDAETYAKATTSLAAAESEVARLGALVPAAKRVKLGAEKLPDAEVNLADMPRWKQRLMLAREAAADSK